MRTHRLFTPQDLSPGERVSLDPQAAHYLARVLRTARGRSLVLFNGDGFDYTATVLEIGRRDVEVEIIARQPGIVESPLRLTLVQALTRGERLDYSLQKATELGVYRVRLLLSERVELRLNDERLQRRMRHWRSVIVSACEQSGRSTVPELQAPVGLADYLEVQTGATRVVLEPSAAEPLVSSPRVEKLELLVGPEGGFAEAEVASMKAAGVLPRSLGPRVLRTETAGPAAIAVLQAAAGDLGEL